MAENQNQASSTTSIRCWVSRRYTLIALKAMASAEVRTSSTTIASSRLGRNDTSGARVKTASAPNSTRLCRKKCTSAAPTVARTNASRGNQTFVTSWAFDTMALVPPMTPAAKKFQASNPERKKMP